MDGLKRGAAAIVGAAESDLGQVGEGMSPMDLVAQGTQRALADCGLTLKDVDGLFCAMTQQRMSINGMIEYLGIQPKFIGSSMTGGSSFEFHLAQAVAAIEAGLCSVALIGYGSTQRSVGRRQASAREINPYETPFNPFLPTSAYALAASRRDCHLGELLEEVLKSRMVSHPFTVRDCCLVTDGGGAIVITSAERAKSCKKAPAYVLGCGHGITHMNISSMPDLTVTGAKQAGEAAYKMAKLSAKDIDVVELYDAFTINTILFLEDLGFCKKGEGGAFVSGGNIAPGGKLPVNTNGGGLSYCHPGMYGLFILIEGVRQLRGECGERQVKKHDTAMLHGNGRVLSAQASVILASAAAL